MPPRHMNTSFFSYRLFVLKSAAAGLACALLLSGVACSRERARHASEVVSAPGDKHRHAHVPPHGGTVVELGEEAAHVELGLDHTAGRLRAYVLDGELEAFIRVKDSVLVLSVHDASGVERAFTLAPVADPATGETAGDTSLFESEADWLKNTPRFVGTLREITVRGATYRDVAFKFPEGGEHEGHDHD